MRVGLARFLSLSPHMHTPHQPEGSSVFNLSTPTRRTMAQVIDSLRQQIASHEASLNDLRRQLAEAEHNQQQQEKLLQQKPDISIDPLDHDMNFGVPDDFRSEIFAILDQESPAPSEKIAATGRWPLEPHEYKRYGRQLIMPEIGLQGEPTRSKTTYVVPEANVSNRRATQVTKSQGTACWYGWAGMPSCGVPSGRRSWHSRSHRWRCRRRIQSTSSNSTLIGKSGNDQSRKRYSRSELVGN